ncbi:MAG: lamin tail domain-containing protein [Candidatus Paceibacterota bacterium]|jgi:hypothetical protein
MKKIILCLAIFFLLFEFKLAYAEVVINEIMYAPASGGSEWIEIFNSGNDSVDLSDWRFFNNKDDSAPLRLQKGPIILASGEYAIITTVANLDSFSGTVFSSSQFSLPDDSSKYNTYKAISDSKKLIVNSITYDTSLGGNKESGNSLQLINGSWKASLPTPGKENSTIAQDSSSDSNIETASSSTQNTDTKAKIAEVAKIKTKITAKTFAFAGVPIEFKANTTGYNNEQLSYGQYFWNFGDGDSKETKARDVTKFAHTFFYEGEYIVSLEYFQNYYSNNPDAVDEIIIKVVKADVSISNVGDEKDFFVEISNNTNYDADLSKWILSSNTKSFILPKNTIIQPKKKIILSPKITGFTILDKDSLKLSNSQWETVFDYASFLNPIKILTKNSVPPKVSLKTEINSLNTIPENVENSEVEMPVENLGATAIKSLVDNTDSKDNFNYGILGLFVFLAVSSGAVYYIRTSNRKVMIEGAGNDFEILDE